MGICASSSEASGGKGGKKGKKQRGSFADISGRDEAQGGKRKKSQKKRKKSTRGGRSKAMEAQASDSVRSGDNNGVNSTTNPLVTPEQKRSSLFVRQSKAIHTEEDADRKKILSSEKRQFEMHISDFVNKMPRAPAVSPSFLGDEDSDEDEGRRCSMRHDQRDAANTVGTAHRKRANEPRYDASKPHSTAAVARHNHEDDCWVIVRGKIYDVTKFVDDHPGGSWMLIKNAGTDATEEFERSHDRAVWTRLSEFYVADVTE